MAIYFITFDSRTYICKRYALDDLELAAECVLHFAKTGELYPDIEMEETNF